MPVTLKKTVANLEGACVIEEVEELLGWLADNPRGKVNLARCEHLHAAHLQVLMALRPRISRMPEDPDLAAWVERALVDHVENS